MTTNHFDITDPAALAALAKQEKIDLTPGQARMLTKAIRESLDSLPKHIMVCLKGKAYRAMGYKSVAEWSMAEFGLSRSRIYQLSAVASAEIAIREQFRLPATFTLSEGKFRPLSSDLGTVLSTIAADLGAGDIADSETEREKAVNLSIHNMLVALEQAERAAKAAERCKAAPAAITVVAPKAESNTAPDDTAAPAAGNVVAFAPRTKAEPVAIDAVALSYELAVVKARDTGKVLLNLSADADAAYLRAALLDAQAVIAELLPFVAAAAA